MINQKYPYDWSLKNTNFTKDKGKVFECFAGGGGSTMGLKLSGFDVIGCNEIDKKMMAAYIKNHNPKYSYMESIVDFAKRTDLPKELYNLTILGGSPPCSSFSSAGNREKDWGKEKIFKEGQKKQVLDTLFFDFIHLAKKLQPKVVIAENVLGIIQGKAIKYVSKIYDDFDKSGYYCKHYVLDASKMGVPQRRIRVFFICLRKDLTSNIEMERDLFNTWPKIDLNFNQPEIYLCDIFRDYTDRPVTANSIKEALAEARYGETDLRYAKQRISGKRDLFGYKLTYKNQVPLTVTANDNVIIWGENRYRNFDELCSCGSWPKDYDFMKIKPEYVIGMSVPPVVMAQIADRVYNQWINKF